MRQRAISRDIIPIGIFSSDQSYLKISNYRAALAVLSVCCAIPSASYAQERPAIDTTLQRGGKASGLWQKLQVPDDNPSGLVAYDGQASFTDWVAASFKNRSGMLYKGKQELPGPYMTYDLRQNGSGYVFDPVMTQDNLFFRFGKVENPIDGFNLLYIDRKEDTPIQVKWVTPERLFYNRVEISPSGRYFAYMTNGSYQGADHSYRRARMALWVTDIESQKVAKVDVGDWITGTYWWDGETLRFLNLRKEPISQGTTSARATASAQANTPEKSPTRVPAVAKANVKAKVKTRDVIDMKRFDPVSGTTKAMGREVYNHKLSLLENYYNAFFGPSYRQKRAAPATQENLMESLSYDRQRREILFISREMVQREEKKPTGPS